MRHFVLRARRVTGSSWEPRSFLASLLFYLTILGAGLVLATVASDVVVQNTDGSAPIMQLRLLAQGLIGDVRELRLARIPSFFPDLLAIWMLMKLGGSTQTAAILLAKYAVLMGGLFLGLQSWIMALGTGLSRWNSLLISLAGTFLLFRTSSLYREVVGITLTPFHHGGNLINTMLAIGIFATAVGRLSRGKGKVAWALLLVLVAVASASNILFFFTACLPLLVVSTWLFLLSSRSRSPLGASVPGGLHTRHRMLLVFSIPLAAASGILASRLFNLQCVSPIETLSLSNLYGEYSHSRAFLFATWAAFALLVSMARLRTATASGVGLVVALSALSPFLYTILLPDLAPRYLLILIMMIVVIVCLLLRVVASIAFGLTREVRQPSTSRSSVRQRWFFREQLHALLVASLVALYLIGPSSTLAARHFGNAYEKQFPLDSLAVELLLRLNQSTGLSDFWGANLAMLSGGRLDVQPIHSNGEPDLWAHNREAFLATSRGGRSGGGLPDESPLLAGNEKLAVKNYSFIYLREEEGNGLSEAEILRAYGEPDRRIGCRKGVKDLCILLYADSSRIQQVIGNKLKRFKSLCIPFRNDR